METTITVFHYLGDLVIAIICIVLLFRIKTIRLIYENKINNKDLIIKSKLEFIDKLSQQIVESEGRAFSISQSKRELEKQCDKLRGQIIKQTAENYELKKIKSKYEFIQSNKPKYTVGDKFGSIEVIRLDVKLRDNALGIMAKFVTTLFCSLLFGRQKMKKSDKNNTTVFLYVTKNMAMQEPVEDIVEESFLDNLMLSSQEAAAEQTN